MTQTHQRPRPLVIAIVFALLISVVVIPLPAEAAPDPIGFSIHLEADPTSEDCIASVDWTGGKGQLFVQIVLFEIVSGVNQFRASHSQKVSAAGDPRGSNSVAHVFSGLATGSADHLIDVTVSRAKGKGGAFGDTIKTISMLGTDRTTICG